MGLRSMNLRHAETRDLSRLLARELAPTEHAALMRHLAECPACRAEFEALARDQAVLRSVPVPGPPVYLKARVMAEIAAHARAPIRPAWARALALAAAVVVIAASACAGVALGSSFVRLERQVQT